MIKIEIKDLQNNVLYVAHADNDAMADAWLEQAARQQWFGKPDRWVREGDEDVSGASETRDVSTYGGSDGIPAVIVTEYHLPTEYTIERSDVTNEHNMAKLRARRKELLLESDWTQLADAPLSSEEKAEWAVYRQALRDLPAQEGLDPANPSWPQSP